MRIDGSEVVKEPFASGEPIVRNLVILEELLCGEPPDRTLGPRQVTDAGGRIDARQEGVDAGGAPSQQGNRMQFLYGVHREQLRRREIPSFEQFRSDIAKLVETARTFQGQTTALLEMLRGQPPAHRAARITRAAAVFATIAGLLAGYLVGRAWP